MTHNVSPNQPKDEQITQFEKVSLEQTGMRGSNEIEILSRGNQAEITYYIFVYGQGGRTRTPKTQVLVDNEVVLDLLNKCSVMNWNGFHGEHPKDVTDGIMFNFRAVVNNGKSITADGSENFPKYYREFERGLYQLYNPVKK